MTQFAESKDYFQQYKNNGLIEKDQSYYIDSKIYTITHWHPSPEAIDLRKTPSRKKWAMNTH